jgi:hypothetical protein
MSEVAIYQPQRELVPVSASPRGELDDWIQVADQVVRLAEVICRSPFVPDGLRGSAPATAAAILTGRELGIPPMTSLANIHVIHGKPGLSALVMRALVMREGHDWEEVEANNTRVVLRGKRKGSSVWTTASFTTADAAIAKLQLGGYPQDKLYARASARLARRAFSDIIAGMPYSIEELEDGFTPDEDGTAAAPATEAPAESPKPRTAQRAARKASPPAPTAATQAAATPAASGPRQDTGGDLPPLPGEDEPDPMTSGASSSAAAPGNGSRARTGQPSPSTSDGSAGSSGEADYDTRGTVTTGQITAIWTVLSKEFEFGSDEKDQARMVCGQILRRDLDSTKNLSRNEAKAILDTLAHWRSQARNKGEDPRAYLIEMLTLLEASREQDAEGEAAGE